MNLTTFHPNLKGSKKNNSGMLLNTRTLVEGVNYPKRSMELIPGGKTGGRKKTRKVRKVKKSKRTRRH